MIEATLGNPRFFSRSGPYPLAVVASTARGIANEVELLLEGVAPLQTAGRNDVSFLDNRRYAAGAAIHDFLLLFSVNRAGLYSYGSQKLVRRVWRGLRRWHQANPIGLAAAHARHHYDISTELYRLFLDDQMQYSCAYFRDPEHETLEQAQRNKLIHATSKLQLKPGMTVAEIGSGWGGLAIHLARDRSARHRGQCFTRTNQCSTRLWPKPPAFPIASYFVSWTIASLPDSLTGLSRWA